MSASFTLLRSVTLLRRVKRKWFILAIMLFSYAMRAVYIESCSMFVRGGVYRVVREAMGGKAAKFSVSPLMFDYVLTGWLKGTIAPSITVVAILIGLGHSLLAMSGEESLAQVYREIEAPKHKNLIRAGLVIFVFS